MCRHLAYLGPQRTLSSVLLEPAHGLLAQSYAPADMRGGGTINADGFGAGWYPAAPQTGGSGAAAIDPAAPAEAVRSAAPDRADPVRVRSDQPLWSDTSFAAVAASTVVTGALGAVRSASPGMPVVSTAAAPFAEGRWLFSLNGLVRGWPGSLEGLAATLPTRDLITLDAPTDAALLWALVRDRLRRGHDPASVLGGVVTTVAAAAPGSRLNLLLTDGATIWATAWDHALSLAVTDTTALVASEPTHTDVTWTEVPDRHLVVALPGRHRITTL